MKKTLAESQAMVDDLSSSRISLRAMLTGMLLCGVIAACLPYAEFVLKGTQLGLNSATPAAFFLLFVLLVIVQPLLGSVRRTWLFSRAELLVITVMMMVATAIPTRGFTGMALAVISGVFYYATPENNWDEKLIPDIPNWIVPQDAEAVHMFYEGLPKGHPIPWETWIPSLVWWFLFMAAFYTVLVCSMIIVRRQWMDNERLIYPLTQVPLNMIQNADPRARINPFLKKPLMWAGFACPFIFHSVNAFSHYYEFVPQVGRTYQPLASLFRLGPQFGYVYALPIRIDFMMMGLAYFINTGVAFSMWFFYLLGKTQETICSILGIYSTEHLDEFSYTGPTVGMLSHQIMGAMIVLVLLGLWTARSHLRVVWRQVWGGAESDAAEMISYRMAVIGMVVGLVVMAVWLWHSGMPAWAVLMFLGGTFTIFLALTRVIVEAGLHSAVNGISPAGFVVSGVGSASLGSTGMLAIGFTMGWANELLIFMMAPCANGLRMLHEMRKSGKRILAMLAVAMAMALVVSIYTTLKLGYKYGAINLEEQYFSWFPQEPYRFVSRFIDNPTGPHWPGWGWTGVGAAVMALLMLARQRFLWWPLHPIGYVVGGAWTMNGMWFSIFLAWFIKTLVLKYAGPRGYRATRWFFLGMVLGQFVVGGFWLVVDEFTGMTGNRIRMY